LNRRRPCCSRGISGGPIALVEDGDTITVTLRLIASTVCNSVTTRHSRSALRNGRCAEANGGVHPDARSISHRVLRRMRATALPALRAVG